MFTHSALAGQIAGVFSLLAFVPYISSTLHGRTKPNRATWWIWTLVGVLLAASYHSAGARHTLWVPVSYVVGPLVVAVLAFKYGEGGWTRFDRGCLLGAGITVFFWWKFRSPLFALLLNLLIDSFGALPTIRKSYFEPEGEDLSTWILFFLGNSLNLFAVERWTFSIAVYPIYMFVLSGIVTLLLIRPHPVIQKN